MSTRVTNGIKTTPNELSEFIMTVSPVLRELASSFDHHVEDESDTAANQAFKQQVSEAIKFSKDLDDVILKFSLESMRGKTK